MAMMGIFHGYSRGIFMGEQFRGRNSVKLPGIFVKNLEIYADQFRTIQHLQGKNSTLRKRALFTASEKHRLGRSPPMVVGS